MEKPHWTRPYCGISYLQPGWPDGGRILKTVCEWKTFVEAWARNMDTHRTYAEKTFRGKDALERAKRWLERQ